MPEPAASHASTDVVAHIALRIGRGLLADGANTSHIHHVIQQVVVAFGYEAHALVEPEAVLVTVQDRSGFCTKIGRTVPAMAVNMSRLTRIGQVIAAIAEGCRDIPALNERLDVIERDPADHSLVVVAAGMALTAGCLARLFGAEWPVVAAAFLAGLVSTLLRRGLARAAINSTAATFATAFVSGLAGALAMRLAPAQSPVLCLAAAGMVLVPGVPLINGVRDLVDGHAGNGTARLTLAAVTLLAIGFALFLAADASGNTLPVGSDPSRLPVAADLVFSALVAIGYATLFNVPTRGIVACMLCGVAGHGLRTALESAGIDLATASLMGAVSGGIVARICAATWHVPAVVFGFPGVVAMMPGSYAFRAGIGGLRIAELGARAPMALIAETLSLTLTTMLVTAAIAIGLSLAFALTPIPVSSVHKRIR